MGQREPPQDLHRIRKPTIFHEAESSRERGSERERERVGKRKKTLKEMNSAFSLSSSFSFPFSFILLCHFELETKANQDRNSEEKEIWMRACALAKRGGKKAIVIHPSPVTLNCRLTVCVIYLCATIKTKKKKPMRSSSDGFEFGVGFDSYRYGWTWCAHIHLEERKLCDKTVC